MYDLTSALLQDGGCCNFGAFSPQRANGGMLGISPFRAEIDTETVPVTVWTGKQETRQASPQRSAGYELLQLSPFLLLSFAPG